VIKNTLSAGATNYPRHVQMGVKFIW
jgi:hypothetical protein